MSNRPSNGQLVALGVELVLFTVISYFGIKWLAKILDPTSKQKEAARKQVYFFRYAVTLWFESLEGSWPEASFAYADPPTAE